MTSTSPTRILLGPGPSPVDIRVLRAMSRPLVGHLDPLFLDIMDEVQELLRYVFQTSNRLTIPISGTGSAGMEAALVNLLEPGDTAVVGIHGAFGERMLDIAERTGARVVPVRAEWGHPLDLDEIEDALRRERPRLLALVHAETSTGVHQDLKNLGDLAHRYDALLVVDAVTSLGGMPLFVDQYGIDVCYSGTQKCLSCPPGLAPITFSERAIQRLRARGRKVQSWYLDMSLIEKYWGAERHYHHTAPISTIYALREALRLVREEGLEARWRRHELNHRAFVAGIEAMGLEMFVAREHRLWSLNTVRIPEGVDDQRLRKDLLDHFNIEIGGGLGPLKGRIWRVGLMGAGSTPENVMLVLEALRESLRVQGIHCPSGREAAERVYHA
ncbi:MAG: alanine--glyoxylate aminotransferase family protein [Acidobacteria bacterium]|nr:MAG: alanine--glyoxylate aminotransferase family protein [Acidobacteriota bacterium]